MANYQTLKAAIAAVIKTNGEEEITGAVMQSALLGMVESLGNGYQFKGIATPSTVVGTPDENVFYIGGGGTYNNFGNTPVAVPPGSIGIFTYNGEFSNTVLQNDGILNVSVLNATGGTPAQYASLSAALAAIPLALQRGGMTITYIQSSDNKYVQCRLMADEWSIDIHDWAFMEGDVYIDNPEFIDAKTDVEGRLLEGIKKDGTKYLAGNLQLNGNVLIGGTIENKDLKEKLDSTSEDIEDIQQRLIFDNIVTEESTNAVTSKGIYNAINANILYQEIAKTDVIYLTKGDTSVYDATAFRAANLDTSKNYRIKVVFNTSLTVEQNRTTILYNTGGGNATLVKLEPGNYTEFNYNFKPTSSNIFFKLYCYQDNIPEGMFYSMEIDEPVYNCHRLNYSLEVKENILKIEKLYLSPLQNRETQFRTTEGHVYRINVKLNRSFGSAMYIAARNENGTNSINVCTVNMTLAATDSGYNYWFLCPYTNARIVVVTTGQDTISDAPFVEVSLFSEYSEQIKDIEQNIFSSAVNNGKTANALAKISGKLAKKEGEDNSLSYDVCIIGAGSAGLNAVYPLIQQGKSVCVIDKNSEIGGTMARAWINCCAATPDTPFFREYVKEMLFQGTARYVNTQYQDIIENKDAVDYSRSLIRTEFRNDGQEEVCITFDVDSYINKMYEKLAGATFLLNTEFVSASTTNNIVDYIVVKDLLSNNNININAKVFIDCSADDVLVRYINNVEGSGYFIGSDAYNRYESTCGFTEDHAGTVSIRNGLNPPTLMFRTKEGTEDLSHVSIEGLEYYLNPYYYGDASKKLLYDNSSSLVSAAAGVKGIDVITQGSDVVKAEIIPYILPYWKYAKINGVSTYWRHGIPRQKFDSVAPMLGIRETYRAACERMLHEEDIETKISVSALNVNNVLDVPIGIANHPVDFHGDSGLGIDVDAINAARKPYFIKFGSIVPLNLNNVFVASRGAGFTHIAAASVRLNKSIMELGYAAGCAANYMVNMEESNSRDVDVDYLKSAIKIQELTDEIIDIIK